MRLDAALGAVFLAGLAAALPAGMRLARGGRDLTVTLRAREPHEIAPRPRSPPSPVRVDPPSLLPRLERAGEIEGREPGLFFRTWQVTYGRRWERQVTVPVLAGAFDPEGAPWPCAVALRFSPQFFDDGKSGGEDVEAVVERVVRMQFPFDVLGLHFAPVASTSLHVRPVAGGIQVSGGVVLADGPRDPTQLTIDAKIALGERDGDLAARIDRLDLGWSGRTRNDPLVALASIFVDVDAQARSIVADKLRGALALFRLPREPLALFPDRPGDRITLRLCDAPESGPDGITVRLRVVASLAEPRLDAGVPGPPHLEARPALPPPGAGPDRPLVEAAVSAAGVGQALYLMWQSGSLATWGRQEQVVTAVRRKLEDRLAFDPGAVAPNLPPVVVSDVVPTPGAFHVRFGDVDLGRLGDRDARVVANGDVLATARVDGDAMGLAATIADLRVDCVEGQPGVFRITPCFSDVVPVLRESGITSAGLPMDLAMPDRLMRLSLVLGTDLVLSGLEGEVAGTPPQLVVRGAARLVRRRER
jgi:hypothetical protein